MKESDLVKAILSLPLPAVLFRNNTGRRGRVSFGLAKGSSDIIGYTIKGARFVAIECKDDKGVVSDDQEAFLEAVRRAGGIGIVARRIEDVMDLFIKKGASE